MKSSLCADNCQQSVWDFIHELRWLTKTLNNFALTSDWFTTLDSLEAEATKNRCCNDASNLWAKLLNAKEIFRTSIQLYAANQWKGEWQSPSVSHSVIARQGCLINDVKQYARDYKRESHAQSLSYETQFAKAHTSVFPNRQIRTLLTASGMSAITLALNLCRLARKHSLCAIGPTYFETQFLLENIYQGSVLEAPRDDLDATLELLEESNADAIFVEPLYNSHYLSTFEIAKLISHLNTQRSEEVWLIIDSTCVPCISWKNIPQPSPHLKIIAIESLAKYWQYGMDLVTAGSITFIGDSWWFDQCSELRARCGLNISDIQSLALPEPDPEIICSRLRRFQNNALFLEQLINQNVNNTSSIALYPKPHFDNCYRGSHLVLRSLNETISSSGANSTAIEKILHLAANNKIDLVHGTSFGFDHTRIYAPNPSSKYGECFLRVSVGTEPRCTLEKIGEIILLAI